MKIIDFFQVSSGMLCRPVVTIGMFDGVHRGHRQLIKLTIEQAKKIHGKAVAITFREHPQKMLSGEKPPLIMSLETRVATLEKAAIDTCLLIDFSNEIAQISPEMFVKKYLIDKIGVQAIIVGQNFRFGHRGKGDIALLKKFAQQYGYELFAVKLSTLKNGCVVSSTNIRQAVMAGNMADAYAMLGYPFALQGQVIAGQKRGRKLGFPTANLQVEHELIPRQGVYCGYSYIGTKVYPALISIGTCPTFGVHKLTVEIHLVNFHGDLYGKRLTACVIEKIRDQIKFTSQEQLCAQIRSDQNYLQRHWQQWQYRFSLGK